MRPRSLASSAVLLASILVWSGCYTMLKSPYARKAPRVREPSQLSRYDEGPGGNALSPRVGRGRNSESEEGDFSSFDSFGSGFSSPYGSSGGYGFPIFGAGTGGPYGGVGSPYGFGAMDPVGYGADPYYQGSNGVLVPPGFELVSTAELDRLRRGSSSSTGNLSSLGQGTKSDPGARTRLQQEQIRRIRQGRMRTRTRGPRGRVPGTLSRRPAGRGGGRAIRASGRRGFSPKASVGRRSAAPRKRGR